MQGTNSAKKALKEAAHTKPSPPVVPPKTTSRQFKPGDTFYRVSPIGYSANDCTVRQHTVVAVDAVVYVTDQNERIPKTQAFTLEDAKEERKAAIARRIRALEKDIETLTDAMRREPEIASTPRQPA